MHARFFSPRAVFFMLILSYPRNLGFWSARGRERMKRSLLFVVIGLVVLAVGVNWYYTRQIRHQLDRMANAVSMFGALSYDSVRLSPGGAVHINELSFRLHQGRGGIDIGRISLQTANLLSLLTLEGKLESGRLPDSLGLSVENLRFPLDGALATMSRQMQGAGSPAVTSGLPFDAAGCDGRTQFSANDLMHMDYFDIRADVDALYQLLDDGNRLRLFASARTYEASAIHLEATLDLPAGTFSARDLARATENARLRAFSVEYEDLGYYERMLAFCAEETGMSRSAYVAHHIQAWKRAWARFDTEPAPAVVAAYESFLEDPQQLSVTSRADGGVSFNRIEHYALPDLIERLGVTLVVNYGEPRALDIRVPEAPHSRVAAADATAAAPAPAETGSAEPGSAADDARTGVRAADDAAGAREEPAAERTSRWVEVDPGAIGSRAGQRVRVRMQSGASYSGRLSRVDSENLHIRVEGVGGFYIRPLEREAIRELKFYDDT